MSSLAKIVLFATLLTTLFSCGSEKEEAQAPKIKAVKKESVKTLDNLSAYNISLPKDMMEMPHLLSVSLISGAPAPTGSAFANKIVYFKKNNNNVFMFESLKGRLSSDSIETEDFLAKFPLLKETTDSYIVDFEKGFDLIFQKSSMYSSDYGQSTERVYEITHSFVSNAERQGKYAFIEQYVRVNTPASGNTPASNVSLKLKYAFSPYFKSASFQEKESSYLNKVGYFENHPVIEAGSGKSTTYITKFDTTQPITYHLTKNIPKHYKQAVTDGILYWNKALGQEFINVEELPETVQIHDPYYNVIQWLDWDTSGFAYANLHADPLTGQTLQGFVYMTSVFGNGGLQYAKAVLKRYLANKKPIKTIDVTKDLGIKGFNKMELCSHQQEDMDKMMSDLNQTIVFLDNQKDLSDDDKEKIYQRVANDYVRQVVAHEVGHTLGLRHNFAGSLKNNLTPENYDHMSKVYFLTGKVPKTIIPGGTVMDYTPTIISSMMGSMIREGKEAFSYDKQAIEWGYTNKSLEEMEFDTFCTDSNADKNFVDCKRFDLFANPIAGSEKLFNLTVNNWSYYLTSRYSSLLAEKTRTLPLEKRLSMIKKVPLSPTENLKSFLGDYIDLLVALSHKAEFVSVRENYPKDLTSLDSAEYMEETTAKKQSEADKLANGNGFADFLFDKISPVKTQDGVTTPLIAQIKEGIQNNLKNIYADTLEKEEIDLINKRLDKYFSIFEPELHLAIVQILTAPNLVVTDNDFKEKLSDYAKGLLLNINENDVVTEVETTRVVPVENPTEDGPTTETITEKEKIFNYHFQYQSGGKDLRMEASKMFSHNFYPNSPSYLRDIRPFKAKVYSEHKKALEKLMSGGRSPNDLAADLYDWAMFETYRFSPLSK